MTDVTGRRMVLAVDATAAVGAGHAMRTAALAAGWRGLGGEVVAMGRIDLPFVARRYEDLGIPIDPCADPTCDVLVVDRYDPDAREAMAAGPFAPLKVLVDDLAEAVPAGFDVVWNPNPYASVELYSSFGGRILAGSQFVALRDDLPKWRKRLDGDVIVTLGGGRPRQTMINALALLFKLMPAERFAVTGDWAPPGARQVDPDHLWAEAIEAKCLVTAAGGTTWEAAAVGVPMVVVVVAENQRLVYRWARDCGVPGVNALGLDRDHLAHQLRALIPAAMIAPPLVNGAGRVARELARLLVPQRAP